MGVNLFFPSIPHVIDTYSWKKPCEDCFLCFAAVQDDVWTVKQLPFSWVCDGFKGQVLILPYQYQLKSEFEVRLRLIKQYKNNIPALKSIWREYLTEIRGWKSKSQVCLLAWLQWFLVNVGSESINLNFTIISSCVGHQCLYSLHFSLTRLVFGFNKSCHLLHPNPSLLHCCHFADTLCDNVCLHL